MRKTLHIGRADVKDSIYKDHTLDVWYERYVREGKLKEKLLEIRRVILRNTMTDIHRETLIPMLIIAVFMNARYGSSNPNFPAVRREVLFNIFDREVMKTPMYASLKALFEVQLDEYHDICPIDQE